MLKQELDITVNKCTAEQCKPKPDEEHLGFGQYFTDHMFTMRWNKDKGWHSARIEPYGPFTLTPATLVFHYGQAIFEGMKAYRGADDRIYLYRPLDNFERMNRSASRICMPPFPKESVVNALKSLVYLDRDWVPRSAGATLYIRPVMIAVEPNVGLRAALDYLFFIITCPVGAYYPEGFKPTKIYVEDKYVRAVPGGVGEAKTAANYAASVLAQKEAKDKGFSEVLWLDGVERRFVEEVGTSNIFFVIDNELITPPLQGSILPGITRDSVLQLAKSWGGKVSERSVSIEEVMAAAESGRLQESFGTGTAAVISPIGELTYQDHTVQINHGEAGPMAQRLYDELQAIQFGRQDDPFGWRVPIA
ncbi:MAG: branched-chain amino acid aminotransferase [Desulfobulbaceae bacterium]|nr:branched-chain amino acid aminotransferase [Desulfobulbaceae bacterium]